MHMTDSLRCTAEINTTYKAVILQKKKKKTTPGIFNKYQLLHLTFYKYAYTQSSWQLFKRDVLLLLQMRIWSLREVKCFVS